MSTVNVERSKRVIAITLPVLVVALGLMIWLMIDRFSNDTPAPTPTPTTQSSGGEPTNTSEPTTNTSQPTTSTEAGAPVALSGKKLPSEVAGWTLKLDEESGDTLTEDASGNWYQGRRFVLMKFELGTDQGYAHELGRIKDSQKIGNAVCGVNRNNDMAYCFLKGSDESWVTLFTSDFEVQEVGALAAAIESAVR